MRARIGNTKTRITCATNSRWITNNTKSTRRPWPKKWARCKHNNPSLPDTCPVLQPLKICRGRRGETAAGPALHRRTNGVADHPVMGLDVAVGEGQVDAAVVIGAGEVAPLV